MVQFGVQNGTFLVFPDALSDRTFASRWSAEGLNFGEIPDPLRRDLAVRYLARVSRDNFGFKWFFAIDLAIPKIIRTCAVGIAVCQLFALVTPLFFQFVVDNALAHRSYSTLIVEASGILAKPSNTVRCCHVSYA